MRQNKRHFTQEEFLLSTFVEFNKCWTSGKRSRLFIESVNGNAFMTFSVFLGHPGNAHFVPKNPQPPKKKKVKSKRKTYRDNQRAANFQERKRKEMEAAVSAAAAESSESSGQNTSSPATKTSSSPEFSFAEPALESISSDISDFATMNMDGNVTIPSKALENSALTSKLNKEVQCLPQGGCDAQVQTDEMKINSNIESWIYQTEWFKANQHKVKPGIREHKAQDKICMDDEHKMVNQFYERHLGRGVSKGELENLWNSDHSEDQVLLEEYRFLQEDTAHTRFYTFWSTCDNPKPLESPMGPFDQPINLNFDRREPCNSPNFDGCLCRGRTWSDSEEEETSSETTASFYNI